MHAPRPSYALDLAAADHDFALGRFDFLVHSRDGDLIDTATRLVLDDYAVIALLELPTDATHRAREILAANTARFVAAYPTPPRSN